MRSQLDAPSPSLEEPKLDGATMMHEEEIVIRDDFSNLPDDSKAANPDEDFASFGISDGSENTLSQKYSFTIFEMFVTCVVMLSTISGGFLEGYTSPAIPSLLAMSANSTEQWMHNSTFIGTGQDDNLTTDGNSSAAVPLEHQMAPEEGVDSNETSVVALNLSPRDFRVTKEESSWLASLLLLGAALGATVSPWMVRLGRRHAIILSALPRFLGWLLVVFASSVYAIYAGRFLCGISVGAVSAATPIYISEVAHSSLRGSLACVVILGVNVGIFGASLLGTFLEWRGLAVAGAVSVAAYLLPFFCIPNSPSWLILRGREDDARDSLRKLRGRTYCVEHELQEVVSSVSNRVTKDRIASWREILSSRRTLLPLGLALLVTVVNRFSGYNAIISYCALFLRRAVPSVSQYWAAVAVCLVQVVATIAAMALVDSWGRRKLLIGSVSVMGLALMVIAACETVASVRGGVTAWAAVLATMTYVGAYSMGIGPLTFVLVGELFPLDARDRAGAIVVVANWGLAFVVTKTYFSMEAGVGLAGTCLIYASVCLAGAVALFVLAPETKGRTLAEIDAHFSYTRGWAARVIAPRDEGGILGMGDGGHDTYSTFGALN